MSPSHRPSPWLTAEEAAPQLATTAHNLRRLARRGCSPILTRRVGGRWLFSRADLARFIAPSDLAISGTTADPPREVIGDASNALPMPAPPLVPISDPLVLPGFEVVAQQPTTGGRTCIPDAARRSRSAEA